MCDLAETGFVANIHSYHQQIIWKAIKIIKHPTSINRESGYRLVTYGFNF
jgi:hypothetical protein